MLAARGQEYQQGDAPVESPRHCDGEDSTLPEVLENEADRIVLEPALCDRLGEWNAESRIKHKDCVGDRECDRVLGEHGRELEVEREPICLCADDVGADCEEEEGDPEKSEEAAKLVRCAGLVRDVEVRFAGSEGDHGAQLVVGGAIGLGDVI